jgi:hypothetical protein
MAPDLASDRQLYTWLVISPCRRQYSGQDSPDDSQSSTIKAFLLRGK